MIYISAFELFLLCANDDVFKLCCLGNLWREIWETAKPVPAVKQSPLYDEDLSVYVRCVLFRLRILDYFYIVI